MKLQIGQRWHFKSYGDDYICEVLDVDGDAILAEVVQIFSARSVTLGEQYTFWTDGAGEMPADEAPYHYLHTQDRPK